MGAYGRGMRARGGIRPPKMASAMGRGGACPRPTVEVPSTWQEPVPLEQRRHVRFFEKGQATHHERPHLLRRSCCYLLRAGSTPMRSDRRRPRSAANSSRGLRTQNTNTRHCQIKHLIRLPLAQVHVERGGAAQTDPGPDPCLKSTSAVAELLCMR